jgi:hypothetical protein
MDEGDRQPYDYSQNSETSCPPDDISCKTRAVDFASLPSLILAIAQERSLTAVLQRVIEAVASAPDVGLARLWLRQEDRACPWCAVSAPSTEMRSIFAQARDSR